jgi:hypothetical protein
MAKINEPTLNDIYDDLAARAQIRFQKSESYDGIPVPVNFDVRQSPIGQDVPVYHEYAFEARMPRGCGIANWGNEVGFKTLEESIAGQTEDGSNSASGPVYEMVQLVKARLALDNGDRLSIKQIALLARMTEKSVSNALHADGDNRLKGAAANKVDTLVENHEALCWLRGRRSFRETTFPEFDGEQPETLSHAEISKYIHDRVYSLYGGEEAKDYPDIAIAQLGWEDDTQRLYDIFVNTSAIHPMDCEALASLIKVDAAWFTEQVMRALFPRQMELSLKSTLSNAHRVDQANGGQDHEAN